MQKVHVIVRSEYDGSGSPEILRVLASKVKADQGLAMLKRAMMTGRVEVIEAEFDPALLAGESPR